MKKIVFTFILIACGYTLVSAQAVFGPGTTGNQTFCTQDVYVCPNGQTVGRTGPNCQFVCSTNTVSCGLPNNNALTGCLLPPTPSYTYTLGCYTYYYNGLTRTTTVLSYNCQNNTWNYYPSSNYGVYFYRNGVWVYGNNQNTYWNNNYNTYQNYTPYYGTNCYYQNGYQVCY